MMCVVTKDFLGAGTEYIRNELVDSSVFRNGDILVQQRFLRPATEMEIKTARLVDDRPKPLALKKKKGLKAKIAKRV